MKKPRITIVGAGLTGSLLSLLLGKRGYSVNILERRADMRREQVDAGRSINLALSSRGIRALQQAGLMSEVEPLMISMRGRMLHLDDGSLKFSPYGQRDHEVIYSISRRDLNAVLMNAAERSEPVNVVFQQQLTGVDFEQRKIMISDERTGATRSETYELLIGADGAGSRVRRDLLSFVGGESSSVLLDHDYKELEIPAGPDGKYQIEREALHIWPRGSYMLIALPNQYGSFTVTLFLPKSGEPSFASLTDPTIVTEFFTEHFPDALELMPDLIEDFFEHPQGIMGTVRCSPWFYEDSAVVVGDAAHAIVPFHGQGMNAGFEDCSELMRLLEENGDDWSVVLPQFDAVRRPNTNAIADMALENYVTMRQSVLDPQYDLKKELGFELEKRFPGRFIPRYSMVMFHWLPYAEALARGETQRDVLTELVAGKQSLADIDFELAAQLVTDQLSKIPEK